MRCLSVFLSSLAALVLFTPVSAQAETYEEYLARLRAVCSVDCMQPREFQRAARRRDTDSTEDMALIMDVVEVRRMGGRFQLLSREPGSSALVEQNVLGSAGIDTSGSTGIGGLPRSRRGGTHPNLIIIELDEPTVREILGLASVPGEGDGEGTNGSAAGDRNEDILVEGERDRPVALPTLGNLRSRFRNRRVVVRGQPRLEVVFIGARRDFKNKQVTLEVESADDFVFLPRFDEDGEPTLVDPRLR